MATNETERKISPMDLLAGMSFKHLAHNRQEVLAKIENEFGHIDDETELFLNAVDALLEGKADKVGVMLKDVIPAHIEACKEQIESLKRVDKRIQDIAYQATMLNKKTINGLSYKFMIVPGPKCVEVESPSALPDKYRNTRFTVTLDIPHDDKKSIEWWEEFLNKKAKKEALTFSSEVLVNKELIKDVLTQNKPVPGAVLGQNLNLRVSKGKVAPTKNAGKPLLSLVV